METIRLPCLKTLPTACMPTRATPKSVGLDLYSPMKVLIPAHDKVLVDVGVAFQIPMGYYASRSGLAIHHHIHVGAGVVDAPNRAWCQRIWLHGAIKKKILGRGEPNGSLTSYRQL